jgi:hypothetical protein
MIVGVHVWRATAAGREVYSSCICQPGVTPTLALGSVGSPQAMLLGHFVANVVKHVPKLDAPFRLRPHAEACTPAGDADMTIGCW